MPPEQPVTQARLASSVELRVMIPVQVNFGNFIAFESNFAGVPLGTISRLQRLQSRDMHRRYMLGRYAYEPLDIIPGRITTDLRIEKITLYSEPSIVTQNAGANLKKLFGQLNVDPTADGDLLGLLGYVGGNLFHQQFPFAIEEIVHPPEGASNTQPTITYYLQCWLKSNPIEYDIMSSDQLIIQECEVACGQVTTAIPIQKAVAPLIRSLLPDVVKIAF